MNSRGHLEMYLAIGRCPPLLLLLLDTCRSCWGRACTRQPWLLILNWNLILFICQSCCAWQVTTLQEYNTISNTSSLLLPFCSEEKRKEKPTPFSIDVMMSLVLYQAAQTILLTTAP